MALRWKSAAILAALLTSLLLVTGVMARLVLMQSFAQLERRSALRDVDRALYALDQEADGLCGHTVDWACWDDTYAFVQDGNREYVEANMVDSSFASVMIHYIVVADRNGRIVHAEGRDPHRLTRVPVPQELLAAAAPGGPLNRHASIDDRTSGLLAGSSGMVLAASVPIQTSNQTGPARGVMIMARRLDAARMKHLGELIRLEAAVVPERELPEGLAPEGERSCLGLAVPVVHALQDGDWMRGYAVLRDLQGRPAARLELSLPREVMAHGREVIRTYLMMLALAGAIIGLASIVLMERLVLSSLARSLLRLRQGIQSLGWSVSLSERLAAAENDELERLPDVVDGVLDELRSSHERLATSERRYRTVVEHSSEGIVLFDARTLRLVEANAAFRQILGREEEPLEGLSYADLTCTPTDDLADRIAAAGGGRQATVDEVDYRRADGGVASTEVSAALLRDGERELICLVVRDVTQRRRAEAQQRAFEARVREAEQLETLGMLAGGVAHDFNNLLGAVLGNAEMLRMHLTPRGEGRKLLEQITLAAKRAGDLTSQLLAYAGRGTGERRPFDMVDLVGELSGLLRAGIPRSIDLRIDLADEPHWVHGDPVQVRQVAMNLITNAAGAIDDGDGRIEIRVERCEATPEQLDECRVPLPGAELGFVCLMVRDTGCGMDDETQRRIFDPFFTTKPTGHGLGLSAVLGILRAHRGGVFVHSAIGEGTTFRVVLPLCAAPPELDAPREPAPDREVWTGSGGVLVVDDEPVVRRLAERVLRRQGFEVHGAASAGEALALLESEAERLRLVLLDLAMPDMDGVECYRHLRRRHPDLPVLFSSGRGLDAALVDLDAHASFLPKPYSTSDLLARIAQMLEGAPQA